MAYGYVRVDRGQLFLLPPSMRDWIPEDHLGCVLIDVVDQIDTAPFHARHGNAGPGRAAYHPDMMLTLLLYALLHRAAVLAADPAGCAGRIWSTG